MRTASCKKNETPTAEIKGTKRGALVEHPEEHLLVEQGEGILVRALRVQALASPKRPLREVLAEVLREIRPSAHRLKLEYMDLVAVKECTDARFLPERFRAMSPEELETKIEELRRFS